MIRSMILVMLIASLQNPQHVEENTFGVPYYSDWIYHYVG